MKNKVSPLHYSTNPQSMPEYGIKRKSKGGFGLVVGIICAGLILCIIPFKVSLVIILLALCAWGFASFFKAAKRR